MTLSALRDDALSTTTNGFVVRLSLPWIRSLPLASLIDLKIAVDEVPRAVTVRVGGRTVAPVALADETGWWFVQDRVVLAVADALPAGDHQVSASFRLVIPYLQTGPDAPLTLPFHTVRTLRSDADTTAPSVSRDVA